MKFLSKIALATITVSMASFASAASISGSTDFRITLPEILVLYHWDDAHLILEDLETTTANDSDPREVSDDRDHNLTATIGVNAYEIIQNPVKVDTYSELSSGNTVEVTLKESWAVRSLSTGNVTLALTNTENVLKNVTVDTSTITTTNAVLVSNTTPSGSVTIEIPSGWEATKGDINFTLNLTNANHSGEYNTRGTPGAEILGNEANDTFLLTLTGSL